MFLNSARASPRLRTRAIHLDGASEPPRFFESNGERIASRGWEICTRIAGVAVNPPGDSTGKFVPPVGNVPVELRSSIRPSLRSLRRNIEPFPIRHAREITISNRRPELIFFRAQFRETEEGTKVRSINTETRKDG